MWPWKPVKNINLHLHYTTLYSFYGNRSKYHILCYVTFQYAPIWTCNLLCKMVCSYLWCKQRPVHLSLFSYASAMIIKNTCSANPLFPEGEWLTLGAEFSLDLLIPNSLRVNISRDIHPDSACISKLPSNLQICELINAYFVCCCGLMVAYHIAILS